MQAVSDAFLGWTPYDERDVYVRQIRDMKGQTAPASSLAIFEARMVLCGGTLARAHARSVDPALLRGYLGKCEPFVESIADFALAYADQSERDHERLSRAVKSGELRAVEM